MDGSSHTADDSAPQPRYRARGDVPVSLVTSEQAPDTGPTISLGPRDVLVGRLVFEGDLRVQGTVEGEATLSGDLRVDDQGSVKARVQARNLDVRDALEVEVPARDRLRVAGSGTVSGTIRVA